GLAVIRFFATGVIGRVTHRSDLRYTLTQSLLDALLQGDVDHAASVATTAELQQHDAGSIDLQQADAPTVRGEPGIDLRFQHVTHPFDHPRLGTGHIALDLRRTDIELAAGGIGLEINAGAVQPTGTVAIDM